MVAERTAKAVCNHQGKWIILSSILNLGLVEPAIVKFRSFVFLGLLKDPGELNKTLQRLGIILALNLNLETAKLFVTQLQQLRSRRDLDA